MRALTRLLACAALAACASGGGTAPATVTVGDVARVDGAFARGAEAKVPYVVGYNSSELPWAAEGSPFFRAVVRLSAEERARAEALYGSKEEFGGNIVSDMLFVEPARNLARRPRRR